MTEDCGDKAKRLGEFAWLFLLETEKMSRV